MTGLDGDDDGGVRVWHASVAEAWADDGRVARALAWLEPRERERHARYRFDLDRDMFLLGRVMARVLVGRALRVDPTAWHWREGPHGRPEVAEPATSVHFNLAHSAGLVTCAVASGGGVGVDVEDLHRRDTDPALVKRYCSPREIDAIGAPADGWRARFLEYWTLKEAYLKARGLGISVHLADLDFERTADGARIDLQGSLAGGDDDWSFQIERLTDRHLVAVATRGTSPPTRAALLPFPLAWLP